MKNAIKSLQSHNFRYNFAYSLKWALPYASGALVFAALYIDSKKRETVAHYSICHNNSAGFISHNFKSPFQIAYARGVEVSQKEYQNAKKELQESLSKLDALDAESDIIATFLENNLSDSKIYVLDIVNELGYNPLTYADGLYISLIIDLYARGNVDLLKVFEKLKTFETEDYTISDAISDCNIIRILLSRNGDEIVQSLIRFGYVNSNDVRKYSLYNKFIQIQLSQEELLQRFSDKQITEVDHLFLPVAHGICQGISSEFLRYHIKHEADNTIQHLNKQFMAKLDHLMHDSSRLKRSVVYQDTMTQHGSVIQYSSIRRELQSCNAQLFFSSRCEVDNDPNSMLNILNNVEYKHFLIASRSHVVAVIKSAEFLGDRFYIFDPDLGIFKVNGVKALLEIMESLILEDEISITPMHQELQKLGFIPSSNGQYHDKDSKNTYKLFEALFSSNIGEIARLSKIQNISIIGYAMDVISVANHIELHTNGAMRKDICAENMIRIPNILTFAIQSSFVHEEALFALIANSTSLDISDNVILSGILARLLTYDKNKASDRVLDALIAHTSSPETKMYLQMTKTALQTGGLVPAGMELVDEAVVVDVIYDPKIESAAKIVELLEAQVAKIKVLRTEVYRKPTADGKVRFYAKVYQNDAGHYVVE